MRAVVAIAFLLCSPLQGWAQDISDRSWFCVATIATGFVFDNDSGKWRQASFTIDKGKFILAPDAEGKYRFTQLGEQTGMPCNRYDSLFVCEEIGGAKINITALRYLRYYDHGYFDGYDNNYNTPAIEIGVCSPL